MVYKAGLSVFDITPPRPVILAGYTHRKIPSEGVYDPLFLRILALEDAQGRRAVLVTADLLKFPKDMAWRTKRWAEETLKLPSASLLINCSHTHCSPGLFHQECYPHWGLDVEYVRDLEASIRKGIAEALQDLRPARIRYGLHQSDLGINRRAPDPERPGKVQLGRNPQGYFDPELPVLGVYDPGKDSLRALFYSYGCHPTSRNFNLISADYPGAISRGLQGEFGPEVATLFAQGAGGNVWPRFDMGKNVTPDQYEAHWKSIAQDIAAFVRSDRMKEIPLELASVEKTFEIPYDREKIPAESELMRLADPSEPPVARACFPANPQIVRFWAQGILERMRRRQIPQAFELHIARLSLNRELQILGFSGEITAELGRMIKDAQIGMQTIFLGYCSYTDAYIPTAAMLPEEGHEAYASIFFHMRPAPFVKEIDRIMLREAAAVGAKRGA